MDWSALATIASFLAGLATFIGSLVWWLAGQFKVTRDLIYKIKEDILSKLEYHERHDDTRFQEAKKDVQSLKDDIWDIRLRNARIDGKGVEKEK